MNYQIRRTLLRERGAHYADGQKFGPNCVITEIAEHAEFVIGKNFEVERLPEFSMIRFNKNGKSGIVSCLNKNGKLELMICSVPLPVDTWSINFAARFLIGILSDLSQSEFLQFVSLGVWK